ncbi:MAG: DUF4142 domain-containing protein [Bacteroidales bacterium]|nr:DUF4142 domain-containing protein [Bacteroidales bacterium]
MKGRILWIGFLIIILLSSFYQNENRIHPTGFQPPVIREFMNNAYLSSLFEIQLGQLAKQKALSQHVQNYGLLMERDHKEVNEELKRILINASLSVPQSITKKQQKTLDKLSKKSGNDFDQSYMELMIEDHMSNIKYFESVQSQAADPELKRWIENTLLLLRDHLERGNFVLRQINTSAIHFISPEVKEYV